MHIVKRVTLGENSDDTIVDNERPLLTRSNLVRTDLYLYNIFCSDLAASAITDLKTSKERAATTYSKGDIPIHGKIASFLLDYDYRCRSIHDIKFIKDQLLAMVNDKWRIFDFISEIDVIVLARSYYDESDDSACFYDIAILSVRTKQKVVITGYDV